MKDWGSIIEYLNQEVDWESPTREVAQQMEDVLKAMALNRGLIKGRIAEIAASDELFEEYKDYLNYPSKDMDILPLYVHPEGLYAIRVHRIKAVAPGTAKTTRIHSHDWIFATHILQGSYYEPVYNVKSMSEDTGTAEVELLHTHTLSEGQTHSLLLNHAHETINENAELLDCYTVFIRGKSFGKGFVDYYLDENTFKRKKDKQKPSPSKEQFQECVAIFEKNLC